MANIIMKQEILRLMIDLSNNSKLTQDAQKKICSELNPRTYPLFVEWLRHAKRCNENTIRVQIGDSN
jgi:hypothetical protein